MNVDILFWTIFDSIFSAFGAVATFSAVIVALWQTKYANRKKLKLNFTDKLQAYDVTNFSDSVKYVGITITNIGNRSVVLQNWGIKCDDGYDCLLVQKFDYIERLVSVLLPYTLEPEHQITLTLRADRFVKIIGNKSHFIGNKRIVFFVHDTTGRKFKVKSNKSVKDYISIFSYVEKVCENCETQKTQGRE